jgi:hypothetical protein
MPPKRPSMEAEGGDEWRGDELHGSTAEERVDRIARSSLRPSNLGGMRPRKSAPDMQSSGLRGFLRCRSCYKSTELRQ